MKRLYLAALFVLGAAFAPAQTTLTTQAGVTTASVTSGQNNLTCYLIQTPTQIVTQCMGTVMGQNTFTNVGYISNTDYQATVFSSVPFGLGYAYFSVQLYQGLVCIYTGESFGGTAAKCIPGK